MPQHQLHLLLVDDERSVREPLQRHLQANYGFHVAAAADAAEALDLVHQNQGQYDVALIDDVLIPGPNGLELMRNIKATYPDIECIIMTGWGTESRQRALESGAFRYIEKPFDPSELALLLRSATQQVRLRAISRSILSKRQLGDVLREIADAVLSLTQSDQVWIVLHNNITDELRVFGEPWSLTSSSQDGDPLSDFPLSKQIITSGRALSLPDLSTTDQDLPIFVDPDHRSLVGVPIPGELGNQGVLYAASLSAHHFAGGLVDHLQTLAQSASVAIANARVFQYSEALVHTGREMARAKTLDEQLQLAWEFVRDHLRAATFIVALYVPRTDTATFPLFYDKGERQTVPDIVLGDDPVSWSITGRVIKNAEEIYWPTAEERANACANLNIRSLAIGDPCQTCFYFPLIIENQVIGAISVQAYHAHAFPSPLLDACRALGNQLAVVIHNTRLLKQSRDQAAKLDQLQQLSGRLASSLELGEIMTFTCQAAVELFGVEHSGLVLFNEKLTQGTVEAEYPLEIGTLGAVIPIQGIPDEELLARTDEPLIVLDVEHRETLGPVRDILFRAHNIQSILIVPIETEGQRLGSFSLDSIGRQRHFTDEEVHLCRTFAASVAVAIQRARSYQQLKRQTDLLAKLEEASRHIRAIKEPYRLQQEVVRLAAQLMQCDAGALFDYQPHRRVFEIVAVHNLSDQLLRTSIPDHVGLVGKALTLDDLKVDPAYAAWSDRDQVFAEQGFQAAVAVPIHHDAGIAAVLFLASSQPIGACSLQDLDILRSFAVQASIALQTSRALSQEQRSLSTLAVIRQVGDYILQAAGDMEKILHVVLTGVTAEYGLSFNRSAILLLNEASTTLTGRIGIGQFTEDDTQRAWRKDRERGLDHFSRYVQLLEANEIEPTDMDRAIRHLSLPLSSSDADLFSEVAHSQRLIQVSADQHPRLHRAFLDIFAPAFPFVIVPLAARGKTIGVLVADNKFTHSPITSETLSTLQTFVNTASLAINNADLLAEAKASQDLLRSYYEASNTIVSSLDLENLLRDIVERARQTARADRAGMALINAASQVHKLIVVGAEQPADFSELVRPNGLSIQIMRTGQPVVVPDTAIQPEKINPGGFWHGVRAALGLPVTLEGCHLGVMWFYYQQPRLFSQPEINAAQLYVNQAAIAYDNARRVEELEQMRQAAEALARTVEPRHALQQIVQSAAIVLHADSVAVWSFDEVRNRFIPEELTAVGIPDLELENLRRAEPKPGQTAEKVMDLGYVQIMNLADPTYTFIGQPTRDLLSRIGVRSFQAVSLRVGDERLGVLYANYHQQRAFSDEEETTLKTFASHAALALKSARLLAQLDRTKQAANIVSESILQQPLKLTLGQIAKTTLDILDADIVSLYAYDQTVAQFSAVGAASIVEQIKPDSIRPANMLAPTSAAFRIINLPGPRYFHVADDNAEQDPILSGYFVTEERIRAAIGIQLRANERRVGVMFVNFRTPHRFTTDELTTVQLFANQAAAAIRNTQLYEEIGSVAEQRARLLAQSQLVADISREAARALEIEPFLESLFSRLVAVFQERGVKVQPSLASYDAKTASLITYPTRFYDTKIRPTQVSIKKKGIMSWVAHYRKPYYAPDVTLPKHSKHYNPLLPDTRSEIAVPVFYDNDLLGVLDLESPAVDAFTSADLELLRTLTNHIAVNLHNIQQVDEIERTKGLVASRTAVALLGLASAESRHQLIAEARSASTHLKLLRDDVSDNRSPQDINRRIQEMEQILEQITKAPLVVALSPTEGVVPMLIGQYLQQRVDRLSKRERYKDIDLKCSSQIDNSVTVSLNPYWLDRLLDLLLKNAASAISAQTDRRILVTVQLSPDNVEVAIADNGPGIPEHLVPLLFRTQIRPDQGANGSGVGLLLAQTIVQTYGGDIYLAANSSAGVTMAFCLPQAQ